MVVLASIVIVASIALLVYTATRPITPAHADKSFLPLAPIGEHTSSDVQSKTPDP
jgi:hypothetical protein